LIKGEKFGSIHTAKKNRLEEVIADLMPIHPNVFFYEPDLLTRTWSPVTYC